MYALEQSRSSNRTRVEIFATILKIAERQTLKTHIMYKANLSHRQLEKYLHFLETKGMITRRLEENVTVFQVTEKGGDFLKDYERISSYLAEDSLPASPLVDSMHEADLRTRSMTMSQAYGAISDS